MDSWHSRIRSDFTGHLAGPTISTAAAAAKSLQPCPTLNDPIDDSQPGSSIPGILQARILGGLPFPFPMHACMLSRFSCVRLCATPTDSSPPGSSVHGILEARILEWVATSFSDSNYIATNMRDHLSEMRQIHIFWTKITIIPSTILHFLTISCSQLNDYPKIKWITSSFLSSYEQGYIWATLCFYGLLLTYNLKKSI